jgi:hypothetical protein
MKELNIQFSVTARTMSNVFLILLFIFFFSLPLFAQSVDTAWVRRYNVTRECDEKVQGYVLEIGRDTGLYSDLVSVPIKLTNPDSISALKLLLHFDQSALTLLNVSKLNTRIDNWEYFQYRLNEPQAGDILILAVADLPNPTSTPPMPPSSGVVANLNFQIILNPCPLDLSTSIKYKFTDSTDNTLSGALGQSFIGQNDIEYKDGYLLIQCPTDVANGKDDNSTLPNVYRLFQNYPNPFNQSTRIEFALPNSGLVSLNIYDLLGRKIRTLVSEHLSVGCKSVFWDGKDNLGKEVGSGIYFYQLRAGDFSDSKKLLLLK